MTSNERTTKKQKELLSYVDTFIEGNGYGPSYREIMRSLGYKSVSNVAIHIDGLINKGYLIKRDKSARSLEVVKDRVGAIAESQTVNPAQEKWLVTAINKRFESYQKNPTENELNEIYVLVGALKVLGLDGAHVAMKSKLQSVLKNSS